MSPLASSYIPVFRDYLHSQDAKTTEAMKKAAQSAFDSINRDTIKSYFKKCGYIEMTDKAKWENEQRARMGLTLSKDLIERVEYIQKWKRNEVEIDELDMGYSSVSELKNSKIINTNHLWKKKKEKKNL